MLHRGFAIEARGLKKIYNDRKVVDDISFQIAEGESYAFLGPNGAGKSSTFKMIYGSTQMTEGEIFVMGLNVRRNTTAVKARIGVVPQDDGLDSDFSVLDNLLNFARYFRIPRARAEVKARELLRFMHLEDYDDQTVETLSGGLRRRLTIARALIHEPALLILDEPTNVLDPQARLWIWDRFLELKAKGVTIVLCTHNMEEAERVCDRVALMDRGRILHESTPAELITQQVGKEVVELSCTSEDINYVVSRIRDQYDYQILPNRVRLFIKPEQDGRAAMNLVPAKGIVIRRANLEDVFLKVTGHNLRDESVAGGMGGPK
jgi:lipooligosaccharide transport system ATP-binding protein